MLETTICVLKIETFQEDIWLEVTDIEKLHISICMALFVFNI